MSYDIVVMNVIVGWPVCMVFSSNRCIQPPPATPLVPTMFWLVALVPLWESLVMWCVEAMACLAAILVRLMYCTCSVCQFILPND